MEPARSRSLAQELQSHQWGGWHRVPLEAEVAEIQEQAMRLEQAGDLEQALEVLNLGLEEWPDSEALLECRGSLYGQMGYWRAAECDFDSVTRALPEQACAWKALGRCRKELGLWHAARAAREEAERLSQLR